MNEAIKQNTPGLYPDIQKIGCFFRAAVRMAEFVAEELEMKKPLLSSKEINELWDIAKTKGYINKNNDVTNSAAIANEALRKLNVKKSARFVEVALFKDGKMQWYRGVPENKRLSEFYIQKIAQSGPNKTHFRNISYCGELLWDPHEPAIIRRGVYYTICYRLDGGVLE